MKEGKKCLRGLFKKWFVNLVVYRDFLLRQKEKENKFELKFYASLICLGQVNDKGVFRPKGPTVLQGVCSLLPKPLLGGSFFKGACTLLPSPLPGYREC